MRARFERIGDLVFCQFTDMAGDEARTEIAVGLQFIGRTSDNRRMVRQIDGIGDDGSRCVRLRRRFCEHGDGIGDAKGKTASMTSAGRDTPRGIISVDNQCPHQAMPVRPVHQADGELFAIGEVQGDIAAIIHIGTLKVRRSQHDAENLFRHRACHRRHRRNEMVGSKWRDRRMHAARDHALQRASSWIGCLTQFGQLFAKLVQQAGEAPRCGVIAGPHLRLVAFRLDNQIDRTILQMQPLAVRKKRHLRKPFHARRPGM